MHDALISLLDKVDIAVAESQSVVDPTVLEAVARAAANARLRLSYPESILIVALAGGTGSGKSSLFNSLAGEEVALTGGIRPMTVQPLALVPAAARGSLDGLLDDLGIADRFEHDGLSWLCLLDLPDNDSVELDHRHQVDALLPRVDMVIWVTDPEKYRDASLHSGHIAPLAGHQRQFLFVLNQVDRMGGADADAVAADLVAALHEDGVDKPEVFMTAAQPDSGPPTGIDRLLRRLEEQRDERRAIHEKLLADLAGAASQLLHATSGARSLDFEKRWEAALEEAVTLARDGRIADAGHGLARFIGAIADEAGGETGDLLRGQAGDIPIRFLECVAGAVAHPREPRPAKWRRRRSQGATSPAPTRLELEDLGVSVDHVIGDPVRDLIARRARAHAAIADMALSVGQIGQRGAG